MLNRKLTHLAIASLIVFAAHSSKAQDQTIVDIAVGNDDFSTLVTALQTAGLVEALQGEGPFTVFAPTNDAFAALPDGTLDSLLMPENVDQLTNILLYHVVPGNFAAEDVLGLANAKTLTSNELLVDFTVDGENVSINEASIVQTDIEASNGVIHVIDQVILPPDLGNIAETAQAAGNFTTLLTALEATGLDETLTDEESLFTVFAPSDEAFAALPDGTLDSLLQEENLDQLSDILLYHVVPSKVIASEVVNLSQAETVNGQSVSIEVTDAGVVLNGNTNVTATDIDTTNGVIHVIDSVLLPQSNVDQWQSME